MLTAKARAAKLFTLAIAALAFGLPAPSARAAGDVPEPPSVAILISMDARFYPRGLAGLLHDYGSYPAKLEKTFRQAVAGSGYRVEVIHQANRHDLYRALHSPSHVAVFWVSHEAPASRAILGAGIDPILVDATGADVKSVFQSISPNVRWVSIVACSSNAIIRWLDAHDYRAGAVLQGYDQAIDANRGLKESVAASRRFFERAASGGLAAPAACPRRPGLELRIVRRMRATASPTHFASVTLEYVGRPLAAFRAVRDVAAGGSAIDEQPAFLPIEGEAAADLRQLKLTVESGIDAASVPAGFALGEIEIEARGSGAAWKPFARPDGRPFGVTRILYLYDGAPAITGTLREPGSDGC